MGLSCRGTGTRDTFMLTFRELQGDLQERPVPGRIRLMFQLRVLTGSASVFQNVYGLPFVRTR